MNQPMPSEADLPTSPSHSDGSATKWVVWLLLAAGAVIQLVRIVQVQSSTGETPFLSANDRSRWCTIASLAIKGTYVIDSVIELRDPKTKRRTWYSIDMVRHRGPDGVQHYYSSKPPLLPTIYTAFYLLIRSITGATLMKQTFFVARVMLIAVNLLPLVLLWWLLARRTQREHAGNLWAICVMVLFLVGGTFLSTFSNTLNNHLPAAVAAGLSLWCLERIILRRQRHWLWFAGCGLATSFTAANELPALSWLVAVVVLLMIVDWRRALWAHLPSLAPVAIAFFVTNYAAHGVWRPAYSQRDLGQKLCDVSVDSGTQLEQAPVPEIIAACRAQGLAFSDHSLVRPGRRPGVFELWDDKQQMRVGLRLDAPDRIGVYEWGDWYDYPGSYWVEGKKQGVDKGEPSRLRYAFHCLFGHHGIFSLTPFWFLSVLGAVHFFRKRGRSLLAMDAEALLFAAMLATSLVCIAFYLSRPLEDRNYGGVCSGLRWVFWLTPMWSWLASYGLKSVTGFLAKRVIEIALIASIFSATYPWANPWTSPWLMQIWPL
jgi:hypothetical protein